MEQVYPVYIASCILNNDLQGARFIRKRIRLQKTKTDEIEAIWSVVVAHIEKSYSTIYRTIDQYNWSEWMQILVSMIKEKTRNQMLTLIPNVYTSIQLEQTCDLFGLGEEELLPELVGRGWEYDADTRILRPMKTAAVPSALTNVNQFSRLADIVIQLEKV
ncbi:unnamed protein product [Rhizopus stolonifer]